LHGILFAGSFSPYYSLVYIIVESNKMAKITFIIPTVGRDTLKNTIDSLFNQTCAEWKAIIIFDGVKPILSKNAEDNQTQNLSATIERSKTMPENIQHYGTIDDRFQILHTEKMERQQGFNSAGYVRNYGIRFVTTEWIAFVDDDDTIKSTYIETFLSEMSNYENDVIIFRMVKFQSGMLQISRILNLVEEFGNRLIGISESDMEKIHSMDPNASIYINTSTPYPEAKAVDIVKHDIGISFAAKKHIFDSGIYFETSEFEDFEWLNTAKQHKYKMMISPYILYFVRTTNGVHDFTYNRIFINHPDRV